MESKAIFLDRDGVINELVYHQEQEVLDSPFTINQFRLISGVPEAIELIHEAGYLAIVISNQPGIAKGHMSLKTFDNIKHKMRIELEKAGVCLDGEYYCLHHPEAKIKQYRVKCDCRKPHPGLFFKANEEMNIDLNQSWMVGDNLSDIQAGKSAGCRTILLGKMKCEICRLIEDRQIAPDHISPNLLEATRYLANYPFVSSGSSINKMKNLT